MVELEQITPEFLTFTRGDAAATIPVQNTYRLNELINVLSALGIKPEKESELCKAINELSPGSRVPPNPNGLRMPDSLTLGHLQTVVTRFIEIGEAKKIRSFEIADGKVIELEGITDQQWAIYEPLLTALCATRIQTESGGVKITPMPYKKVKEYFPENETWPGIRRHHVRLSKALVSSGWFIDRKEQLPKNTGSPWFLRGPNDGVQNKRQPKPEQESGTLGDEKKRAALKKFDTLAFGTRLLHSCVSNLANPEVSLTKDLEQLMSSQLPSDLKLEDVLRGKTPQEYFQGIIKDSINSMAGKTYEELSEIQQKIMLKWNELKIKSGQKPMVVILDHFKEGDSSRSSLKPREASHQYRLP